MKCSQKYSVMLPNISMLRSYPDAHALRPGEGVTFLGAAVSITRVQGGMWSAETEDGAAGEWAAEIGGREGKAPDFLRSPFEPPSKLLRSPVVTSRSHHACNALAACN